MFKFKQNMKSKLLVLYGRKHNNPWKVKTSLIYIYTRTHIGKGIIRQKFSYNL